MRPAVATIAALVLTVPAAAQVRPGQWETTVTIRSIDMPGTPPQVAKMMKGKTTRQRYCLTPEQAAKGPREMIKQTPSCRFTRYVMTDGRLSTTMICIRDGGTMTAQASGRYTPTTFDLTSSAVMSGRTTMKMDTTNTGRRIGACGGK